MGTTTLITMPPRLLLRKNSKHCHQQSLCLRMKPLEVTSLFATTIPWQRISKDSSLVSPLSLTNLTVFLNLFRNSPRYQ